MKSGNYRSPFQSPLSDEDQALGLPQKGAIPPTTIWNNMSICQSEMNPPLLHIMWAAVDLHVN